MESLRFYMPSGFSRIPLVVSKGSQTALGSFEIWIVVFLCDYHYYTTAAAPTTTAAIATENEKHATASATAAAVSLFGKTMP